MPVPQPAVRFEGITRRFPGVLALEGVSFEVAQGSCHALCGENGAGKSTLGKILAGIHPPDEGRVVLFGEPVTLDSPQRAIAAGVAIVHQELAFCENLTVAENLCLDALPHRGPFVSRDAMRQRAAALLAAIDAPLDLDRTVGDLGTGQQQMLQIAAAVGRGARVIVFDEPTSSLSQHEAEKLYGLMASLRARGVTLIYVSHRMDEIFRLCDAITVLRDGRHVVTADAAQMTEASLVEAMIGRRLGEYFPRHVEGAIGPELLRVEALSSLGRFSDVSFSLRAGEVVGLAGLVGAGRSEIARALFGLDPAATGQVWIAGTPGIPSSPAEAMRAGVGLVPEDRKRQGLVLSMSALANTTLPTLSSLARLSFVRRAAERAVGRTFFDRLRVRASSPEALAAGLSGGTQQKLVLAKWLAANCRVMLLDEPTRGVDVGAKAEMHALIDELAAGGAAVLLISSELPEVLYLSTRILVLRDGRLAGEMTRSEATQSGLMRLMAGAAAS